MLTATRPLPCDVCNDALATIKLPNPADQPRFGDVEGSLLLCSPCAKRWLVPADVQAAATIVAVPA